MAKTLPIVSIIIPTFNSQNTIGILLSSLKNQNYQNIETIVVDNFSGDKTCQIAKEFTPLTFQKGPERSSQRNFGASVAKGEYLLFVDSDQEMDKGVTRDALGLCERQSCGAVVIPEVVKGSGFWAKCLALEKSLYQDQPNICAARFITRRIFEKVGGYDQDLVAGEDWDLHQRLIKAGAKIGFSKSPIYNLEQNTTLLTILKKKFYYAKNIQNYAKKHPKEFAIQANFIPRLTNPKALSKMSKDPAHALGLIFLKVSQTVVGILGLFFKT